MNKNKIIIIVIVIAIFLIGFITILCNKKNSRKNNDINEKSVLESNINKNEIAYKDNSTIEELKNDVGISGNSDIYDIETEYDGRKALVVKASLKYKVAFAGMIKKDTPTYEELDEILNKNIPTQNGIWVPDDSRDKVLNLLNNNQKTQAEYSINDGGYINIINNTNQTNIDKKIEEIIKSDKQYIWDVSGTCYIIDNVTGEIYDWNFEEIDKYQTYEYFEDENKMIMFITENSKGKLTNEEILESIIELL